MMEIWPAILVSGLSFAVPQFLVSNYIGPELVDVIAAISSMVCLVLFLRVWKPKTIWTSTSLERDREAKVETAAAGLAGGLAPAGMPPLRGHAGDARRRQARIPTRVARGTRRAAPAVQQRRGGQDLRQAATPRGRHPRLDAVDRAHACSSSSGACRR